MKRLFALLLVMLVPGMVLAQDSTEDTAQEHILKLAMIEYPRFFDPLLVTTTTEIEFANNLFIGLTRLDPVTQEILPGLAKSWSVSDDGKTWEFTLRNDVPWVKYSAENSAFEPLRMITAQDVLFSFQRLCSSRNNGYYAVDVFAAKIAGCEAGQAASDGTLIEAEAPSDTMFKLTLTDNYSYFLSMTHMWTIRPVPAEVIEEHGADWILPQHIVISGSFAPLEIQQGVKAILVKNPFYPADLWSEGNLTRVEISVVSDVYQQLALYKRNQIDRTDIPLRELISILQDEESEDELNRIDEQIVYYFGFVIDKPPFDDVHFRRALAASIDRQAFIDTLLHGNGTPIAHFTPPGLAHAPDLAATFDVGFNPEYAQEQLAESAYPECENLPVVKVRVMEGTYKWAEFLINSAAEILGCDPAQFDYDEARLDELQVMIQTATESDERPNLFTLGWGPDYGDADSFATRLACGIENTFQRTCNDTDKLILQARSEPDADKRDALYSQIEAAFFGEEGEFPMIPLYMSSVFRLKQPWFTGPFQTDGQYGGIHYDAYTLDLELVAELRIECNVVGLGTANLRSGAATTFSIAGKIERNQVIAAITQTKGRDGYVWWQLVSGEWVRSDVVREIGSCERLPEAFSGS